MWRKTQFFLWEAVVKDTSYHAFSHLRNFARKVQIAFSMLNYELGKNCLGQPRKWQQTDFSAESQKENWKDQEIFVAVQKGRNSCKIMHLLWSWYGKGCFVFTTYFLLSSQTPIVRGNKSSCPLIEGLSFCSEGRDHAEAPF